jgi:hypothetical protein
MRLWESDAADGRVVFDARQKGLRYSVIVAGRTVQGGKARLRIDIRLASLHYVLGTLDGKREYACLPDHGRLACRSGDPGGEVNRVVGQMAGFLFPVNSGVFFTPPAFSHAKVTQRRTVGQPVSCLSGTAKANPVEVCVTRWGYPTQMALGGELLVNATSASPHATDSQIRRPA